MVLDEDQAREYIPKPVAKKLKEGVGQTRNNDGTDSSLNCVIITGSLAAGEL